MWKSWTVKTGPREITGIRRYTVSNSTTVNENHFTECQFIADFESRGVHEVSGKTELGVTTLWNGDKQAGVSPGGSGSFSFTLTNTGNGDDTYSINLQIIYLKGGRFSNNSTLTISKDGQRTTVFHICTRIIH